jgi:hypothetical protein
MVHLRQDKDFREVARYSGIGQVNPMTPYLQPNAINYLGTGPAYGQAGFPGGAPSQPTGFVWEGVRFFETTNMPEFWFDVNMNGVVGQAAAGVLNLRGATGLFFGPQAVGIGIGGPNAQVLTNSNDDFARFVILIWQLYAGWECLNTDFITVAHSFVYETPVRP